MHANRKIVAALIFVLLLISMIWQVFVQGNESAGTNLASLIIWFLFFVLAPVIVLFLLFERSTSAFYASYAYGIFAAVVSILGIFLLPSECCGTLANVIYISAIIISALITYFGIKGVRAYL